MSDFDIENDIRLATPDDFQELFRIACLLHSENGAHAFSKDKVTKLIWRGCNRDNSIIGVIGNHNDIRAMIFLSIEQPYYSDEHQLVELWNYVRPDSRKSDFAKKMILFAKKCAVDTKLVLMIGVISSKQLEAKSRLYSRLLPAGGTFFIYRPDSCGT
jgi:hypothetical protein